MFELNSENNAGLVHTPFGEKHGLSKELMEWYCDKVGKDTPLGRIATCQDVAKLVAFIASDEAEFLNGSLVLLDGGLACRNFLQ